ncbi:DUF4845 domain-containing protein [Arhodomonas sp. SL1]|uniref:DUF4845 domain-containing protein n=1 Tax=Arhodomonas sp. SL1 TaxID=3425691 RepID=UPI003F8841BF
MNATRSSQQGMTITQLLVGLVVIGFLALVGARLIPVYIEAYSVGRILEGIAAETRYTGSNRAEIRRTFSRRLSVNDIDSLEASDLELESVSGGMRASVAYEVRRPLIGNLDVVARFDRAAVIPN